MSSYRKYIRVAISGTVNKRNGCQHKELWDDVIYRRCKCCGAFKPFRAEEDVIYKNSFSKSEPLITVDLTKCECSQVFGLEPIEDYENKE